MTAQTRDTIITARPARRADAGTVRLSQRDIDGLMRLRLLRKAAKGARWLVLAAAAAVVWPVTVVTLAGYLAACLRGWPPVRLYRAAAWSLLVSVAWLAGLEVSMPGWLAARTPGRAWAADWDRLDAAGLARVFLLLAPVALPAGLALAGLTWAWRNYAITASAPATFDARERKRQVRTGPVVQVPEPRHEPAPEPWPVLVGLEDIFGPGAPR
jgi:hypothetical protein